MEFFKYSKFWIEFLQTHLQLNIGIFIISYIFSRGIYVYQEWRHYPLHIPIGKYFITQYQGVVLLLRFPVDYWRLI